MRVSAVARFQVFLVTTHHHITHRHTRRHTSHHIITTPPHITTPHHHPTPHPTCVLGVVRAQLLAHVLADGFELQRRTWRARHKRFRVVSQQHAACIAELKRSPPITTRARHPSPPVATPTPAPSGPLSLSMSKITSYMSSSSCGQVVRGGGGCAVTRWWVCGDEVVAVR